VGYNFVADIMVLSSFT